MDTDEIKALKNILRECPFLGFHGGGISESDDWSNEHKSLIHKVNKLTSDALVRSGCVIEDDLKDKLFRYETFS
jgi:hypothetical protein